MGKVYNLNVNIQRWAIGLNIRSSNVATHQSENHDVWKIILARSVQTVQLGENSKKEGTRGGNRSKKEGSRGGNKKSMTIVSAVPFPTTILCNLL